MTLTLPQVLYLYVVLETLRFGYTIAWDIFTFCCA